MKPLEIFSKLLSYLTVFNVISNVLCDSEGAETSGHARFKIEGKVSVPFVSDSDWISHTRVMVDGGQFLGFLKSDGTFSVSNLPSGTYVVEIVNPTFVFEPARIDINTKGKIRARRVDYLQNSKTTITYPLKFKAKGMANYFQKRDVWRITDFIFSPMVLMMVGPLLLFMVLPKLINTQDPETQREMQQSMNMLTPKQNMPDMSEMLTKGLGAFWGDNGPQKKPKAVKPGNKRK